MTAAAARRALVAAAIFGVSDGMVSNLGVDFGLRAHPGLVVVVALLNALAGGLSMAGGRWASEDNNDGIVACLMLGLATSIGTVLPASPFLWLHGAAAIGATDGVCVAMILAVAAVRGAADRRRGVLVFVLLSLVVVITLVCALAAPTGGVG